MLLFDPDHCSRDSPIKDWDLSILGVCSDYHLLVDSQRTLLLCHELYIKNSWPPLVHQLHGDCTHGNACHCDLWSQLGSLPRIALLAVPAQLYPDALPQQKQVSGLTEQIESPLGSPARWILYPLQAVQICKVWMPCDFPCGFVTLRRKTNLEIGMRFTS